jgi:hypothetical protein
VRHFRYLLDGRRFHILTDHKPLTQALHRVSDPWTSRQQRQLAFLAELTSDIRHIAGKANVVADALSRPPQPQSPVTTQPGTGLLKAETCGRQLRIIRPSPQHQNPAEAVPGGVAAAVSPPVRPAGLDFAAMAREQALCEQTRLLESSSSLQLQSVNVQGARLLCDISLGTARPVVRTAFRQEVFDAIHSISHPGIRASKRLISARFVWKGMGADVSALC